MQYQFPSLHSKTIDPPVLSVLLLFLLLNTDAETCYKRECTTCYDEVMMLDLDGTGGVTGNLPTGITVEQAPTSQTGVSMPCSKTALLKVPYGIYLKYWNTQ